MFTSAPPKVIKWVVCVRIFEINIIIIMVHVIYRTDFSIRKVNVIIVTL